MKFPVKVLKAKATPVCRKRINISGTEEEIAIWKIPSR